MGVTVQQACCDALGAYLQLQFNKLYDPESLSEHVQVLPAWAELGVNLPPKAVTVILAGRREDTHLTEEVVRKTDKPDGLAEFEWSIKAFSQPIQIDIWAQYDSVRDEIENDLDTILHRGPAITLGVGYELVRDGVLLRLDAASGHQGIVDYTFDGARTITDGDAVGASEFRSMISGTAECDLTVKATVAKLARVKVQATLDASALNFVLQQTGGAFALSQ